MNAMIFFALVISLGLASPSAGDEVENVLDCAPKVVLDAGSLETDFLALESILQAQVNSSKVSKNFDSLTKAAKELGSQKDHPVDSNGDAKKDRRLKKAIKKFTKLERSLNKCDFSGYYHLASNYKAALNCPLLQSAIREAITRHGNNCLSGYHIQFSRKLKKTNKNLIAIIDRLIDRQVLEGVFGADSGNQTRVVDLGSMDNVLKNNLWASIRKVDELLLMNIVELVKRSKQGKYFKRPTAGGEVSKGQAAAGVRFRTKVYQRKLIKPCKRFVKEFAEIFYPAKLDLAAETEAARSKLAEINPKGEQQFTDVWLKFRVCQAIREDTQGVLKRISAVAESKLGLES